MGNADKENAEATNPNKLTMKQQCPSESGHCTASLIHLTMNTSIGIGLRKEFAEDMLRTHAPKADFLELAPENWMGIGGHWKKVLERAAADYPIICHGLSLSIGGPDELDTGFIKAIRKFLDRYAISMYSEHLSFSSVQNAHLYDLLPIPFRKDAVQHITQRIHQVQDILQRPLVLEIVSYYSAVAAEMSEIDFINSIVKESGCRLLLDINNVYVNAFNHGYDARDFISRLPLDQVSYLHMAGHEQVSDDLLIDTHGQAIIDPVYELLEWSIRSIQPVPVLLERDFNIPAIPELQQELNQLRAICDRQWKNNTHEYAA